MKRAALLLLCLCSLFASSLAFADTASEAFNDGKRLMGKAKYAEACEQFAKAESTAGPNVKTRYWTGRCSEEQGLKSFAFLAYKDAKRMAVRAGDTKRAAVIDQRISELGKVLPFLVITVPPELARLVGLTVHRDGVEVPKKAWGEPVPVDVGKHRIRVSAPGYDEITLNVTASEPGSKAQLIVPKLSKTAVSAPAPGPKSEAPGEGPVPLPDPGGSDEGPQTKRKSPGLFWTGVGLVAAGGIFVIAGAAVLGANAENEADNGIHGLRDNGVACDAEPNIDGCNDDHSASLVKNRTPQGVGLLIAGGVFLGVGIPFMVVFGERVPAESEGDADKQSFTLQPVVTPGGLSLRGTF